MKNRLFLAVFCILFCLFLDSQAQVAVTPYITSQPQFFDNNGNPLASGCLFAYQAGTTTPQNTYTDSTGTSANTNPIIFNAAGYAPSAVWLSGATAYKFVLKSFGGIACASGSTIRTEDNLLPVVGANYLRLDGTSGTATSATFSSFITGNGVYTPFAFGAKGNAVKLVDGSITSGTSAFTSASASFVAGDVGKAIVVTGAGTSGVALVTTISAFVSGTAVTLSASASTTVTAGLTYYGTDDTVAIRSCVTSGTNTGGKCTITNGKSFMMSNTLTTIALSGAGMIDGTGTLICAPAGSLSPGGVGGLNDRCFKAQSTQATPIQVAAGAIAKGATSFVAQNAGDVSSWVKGDQIILTEKDAGIGDVVYVDWMTVSSVAGTTVNVLNPFRMAFPNARTFNVSGTPANCVVAGPCGLSARKITGIVSPTFRDFTLLIPDVVNAGTKVVGINTQESQGGMISNFTCINASQNCLASYLDSGLTVIGNHINDVSGSEFAAETNVVITNNAFVQAPVALNNFSVPTGESIDLDLGSGFGSFSNNVLGPSFNDGIRTFGGVHDMVWGNNSFGWNHTVGGGSVIHLAGGYRNTVIGNTMAGADGASGTGIGFTDTTTGTVNINSDNNLAVGNILQGFPFANANAYLCTGTALGTDKCIDPINLPLSIANTITGTRFGTLTNCSSPGGTCSAASAGSVDIAAAATTVTVSTTSVTANSQIILTRDNSLGTKLGVTCNTQSSLVLGTPYVSARTAATSFVITIDVAPTTNPLCIGYLIVN